MLVLEKEPREKAESYLLQAHERLKGLGSDYTEWDKDTLASVIAPIGDFDLYVISKDLVVISTTFEADQGLDFHSIGKRFAGFLDELLGTGKVFTQRAAFSNLTGRLHVYSYYSPPGGEYILQSSVDLLEYIRQDGYSFTPSTLFGSLLKHHSFLLDADLFSFSKLSSWSLVTGKRIELDEELAARLRRDEEVRVVKGNSVISWQPKAFLGMDNPFGEIFVLMLNYDMGYYNAVVRTLFLRSILITLVMTAILATLASLVIDRVLISKVLKFRIKLQRACEGDYSAWVSQEQSIPEYRDIAEGFNSLVRAAAQRESDLARHAEELSAAVNQRDVLLREIHHRVKNNLQIINSLIAIEQARVDPSSGEMFVQIGARVRAMSAVHEILYEAENLRGAQLEDLVERVFQAVMAVYNIQTNDCAFSYDLPELLLAVDQAIPLSLLMTEAFTNAMKYGRKGGKVQIQVTARLLPKGWMLQIRDNGNGFPDSLESSEGFGFVLMKGLAEQLDGTFEAFNDNGAIVRVDIGAML